MNSLKLNDNLSLGVEAYEKRVRLIVYKDAVELVCRKEYWSKLIEFIRLEDERIFKGRLQLTKRDGTICVEIRGAHAGCINVADFAGYLENARLESATVLQQL